MKPHAVRKQMLILESDLNRAQLAEDWRGLADDVHALGARGEAIQSLTSAAVAWLAGRVLPGGKKSAPEPGRKPWWQGWLQGVQLAGSVWSAWRGSGRKTPKP